MVSPRERRPWHPRVGELTGEDIAQHPTRAIKVPLGGSRPDATVAVLPLRSFQNGHIFFHQRLSQRLGERPICVHATYSGAGLELSNSQSKTTRFQESGLWLLPPSVDERAEAQGARYLTWDNSLPDSVAQCAGHSTCDLRAPWCTVEGGQCQIDCHRRAVALQLARLRNVVEVARLLRRTVVFPPALCHCDRGWQGVGQTLHRCCRYTGAETEDYLPIAAEGGGCPWDLLVPRHRLLSKRVSWRPVGFLDGPAAPKGARLAAATRVHLWPQASAPPKQGRNNRVAYLPAGATASQVHEALDGLRDVNTLVLEDAEHSYCGAGADSFGIDADRESDLAMFGPPVSERRPSQWFTSLADGAPARERFDSILDPTPQWCTELMLPRGNCSQNFPPSLSGAVRVHKHRKSDGTQNCCVSFMGGPLARLAEKEGRCAADARAALERGDVEQP